MFTKPCLFFLKERVVYAVDRNWKKGDTKVIMQGKLIAVAYTLRTY